MNKDQMLQEERELEARLFGTPKVAETTATKAPIETEETPIVPEAKEVVATEATKPIEEATDTQEKEEDWKLRFTNLRSSRDSKLYDTQVSLATAQNSIALLQQKVNDLLSKQPTTVEDPFKDAFTEEEREALGPTAIAAMQRTATMAADARTADINKQLAEARSEAVAHAKQTAKSSADVAYSNFETRLESIVPTFREVNMNPAFAEFMQSPDIDGMPRSVSFLAAESRGDAATVGKHFRDFLAKENPKAQAKASLDLKVGPTGIATSATVNKTETNGDLTMAEINAHYKRHALGKYAGKQSEYLAMEAKIDAAAVSGRIKR